MQFMSSGPSHVLVISQIEGSANVVPAWREFIGPADIEEARRNKPERLVTEIIPMLHSEKELRKHQQWH